MANPSRVEFMDQVAQLVCSRFPLVKLERNEADFSLRINGNWTSLENLYRITLQKPDQLMRHVEVWVTELLRAAEGSPDQTAPFDELRERIFPMILSAAPRDVGTVAMVSQQLLEGLTVAYALDGERTISYIPRKLFVQWNISIDDLHEAALGNLVSKSESLPAHAAEDPEGKINLILIQTMDGYDASRILLPGLHEHLREHLGSPFLAGIPNRDILVCFRNDPETLARMQERIAEDYRTMPHQVSPRIFLITADGIAPFAP